MALWLFLYNTPDFLDEQKRDIYKVIWDQLEEHELS